jgi:hypothetical protein
MRTSFLACAAGLTAALTIFIADTNAADPVQDAFERLGFVYLDHPATRKGLDDCFRSNDKGCLSAFADQRRAALTVFDQGPRIAMDRVLGAVGRECASLNPHASEADAAGRTCAGAINSFYFFSSDAEDLKIVDHLRGLPESTLWNVFAHCFDGDWIANRPDKRRWITLIDDLKILDKTPEGRAGFKNVFRSPPSKLTSGIDLVDPRVDLPKWQAARLGVPR